MVLGSEGGERVGGSRAAPAVVQGPKGVGVSGAGPADPGARGKGGGGEGIVGQSSCGVQAIMLHQQSLPRAWSATNQPTKHSAQRTELRQFADAGCMCAYSFAVRSLV